jgi:hypothetical protein
MSDVHIPERWVKASSAKVPIKPPGYWHQSSIGYVRVPAILYIFVNGLNSFPLGNGNLAELCYE